MTIFESLLKNYSMEGQEKIFRIIDFILTLNSNHGFKKETLLESLSISDSTFRRYIDNLKTCGFAVKKEPGNYYRIDPDCSLLNTITSAVLFSDKQKQILSNTIEYADADTDEKRELVDKISNLCYSDPVIYSFIKYDELTIIKKLREAIDDRKVVILKGYESASSSTIKDRVVEPFKFFNGFRSVWCYDVDNGDSRVFKISRITDIKPTDKEWSNKGKHNAKKSDLFGMTGDSFIPVELILSQRAKSLLEEEFYSAGRYIKPIENNKYLFSGKVTSFNGVGRFIRGLHKEIDIISPVELIEFVDK